jgi:hypothetical protein
MKGHKWVLGLIFITSLWSSIFFLARGCGKKEELEAVQAKPMVVSGVVRVFMHQPGHYTFFVKQADNKIGQLSVGYVSPQRVTIIEGLSEKETMRVEIVCGQWGPNWNRSRTCRSIPQPFAYWYISQASRLTIHLHSVRQVDGAGWDHGKNGRGTTTVIE